MASIPGSPRQEPTSSPGGPGAATSRMRSPTPGYITGRRAGLHEDDHAPAVPSPLNPATSSASSAAVVSAPTVRFQPPATSSASTPASQLTPTAPDESTPPPSTKPTRIRKETLKRRESKGVGGESGRATPDPKAVADAKSKEPPPDEVCPQRYKLGAPKLSDFDPPRGPMLAFHHAVTAPDGTAIEFHETSEHVYNKRNFHYTHCIADPRFPHSNYYRQTEPAPYGAHMSFEDAATQIFFDQTCHHLTTEKGFRMARANVAAREGRWFWECRITRGVPKLKSVGKADEGAKKKGGSAADREPDPSRGHVRMGWARREASLDAPVGFDAYSYGLRDLTGQKVHMSRPKGFFPPGEDMREGDVIGMEIQLPSLQLHRKVVSGQYNPAVDLEDGFDLSAPALNIVRDRIPIRFKSHLYFEKVSYHPVKELEDRMSPAPVASVSGTHAGGGGGPVTLASDAPNPNHPSAALRTLPRSSIKVYKNGVLMGTPFEGLLAFLPPASRQTAQLGGGGRGDLDDGMLGYYPAVSVFRGGAAEVNFGPKFWYPPPGYEEEDDEVDMIGGLGPGLGTGLNGGGGGVGGGDIGGKHPSATVHVVARLVEVRPISERYTEQICEDFLYDVIDEVTFWAQDRGRLQSGRDDERLGRGGFGHGKEGEIKELVQDD